MHYRWLKVSILSILLCSMFVVPAFAFEKLEVAVNNSRVLNLSGVERIAVASPEIADVVVVSSTEVVLVGKAPGTTTMHVWSKNGRSSYTINVTAGDQQLANEIEKTLGLTNIKVMKTGKTIVLEGKVHDSNQKKRVEMMASAYGEKIVNLLEIVHPVQVKIEAKIIEIDKSKVSNLGVKWGSNTDSPGSFSFGQGAITKIDNVAHEITTSNPIMPGALGKMGTFNPINGQIDAMVKEGVAKILSQPNMVTLSGEKASIMVGGEIPLPMAGTDGKISFEFKEYGIKLEVEPTVTSEGLINSKIIAEVSSIDWNSAHKISVGGGASVPSIRKNKAQSVIVLSSGQNMAIGGLLSNSQSNDIVKIPLLGDLPVIGSLFRSKGFSKDQTEMIIIITPTIVGNIDDLQKDNSTEMNSFIKESVKKADAVKVDKTVKKADAAKVDKNVKKADAVKVDKTVKKADVVKVDKTVKKTDVVKVDKTVKKTDKTVKKDHMIKTTRN